MRLLDAESDELLREAFPSRNDTAQPVVWNTSDLVGRRVIVEVVDGDRGDAYAWLAVGRFSVDALNPSAADTERQAAASLIAGYRLADLIAPLGLLITELPATTTTRIAAADAVNSFQPDARLDAVTVALSMPAATDEQGRWSADCWWRGRPRPPVTSSATCFAWQAPSSSGRWPRGSRPTRRAASCLRRSWSGASARHSCSPIRP